MGISARTLKEGILTAPDLGFGHLPWALALGIRSVVLGCFASVPPTSLLYFGDIIAPPPMSHLHAPFCGLHL